MRRLLPLCFIAIAVACGSQSEASRAHAIESQVWSPYCPGRLLIDCTTQQARELRVDIAERVQRGEDSDEILSWIRDEFGPTGVARPSPGATGFVIWIVPVAIFAIGAAFVVRAIRKGRTAAAGSVAPLT